MRSARLGQGKPKRATKDIREDVLTDLGMALEAFGTALQLAGKRLQTNQFPLATTPQMPAPVPITPVARGLPAEGYVRIWDIIGRKALKGMAATPGMIPVSRATWYSGVRSGRFPKPIKHGGVAMWRVEEIRDLIAQLAP
jgi:prophage regulatory protein